MANVQPENGCIEIALDLDIALIRAPVTGLEQDVIRAVIHLTYGIKQTKAEISTEDIRYMLGAEAKNKSSRIEQALDKLIRMNMVFKQELTTGTYLLGVQKDYDRWEYNADKMSPTINKSINTVNTLRSVSDKMSTPQKMLDYAQKQSNFKYSLRAYRVELKYAKQIYMEALQLTRSPVYAAQAIRDFIDEDEFMRQKVKFQFTYMSSRFKQWYRSRPAKPKAIKEQESDTGYKFIYNSTSKQWEISLEKL